MKIQIKKLASHEVDLFTELIRLFEDVFEMKNFNMPDEDYLQNMLEKEDFFVFAALSGGQMAGGLTSYTLQQYYSKLPLVYIYDLAVKTDLQRRGIGKLLISAVTDYCREAGMEEVFVQADAVDGYALDFYRSTGATEEEVVHFYYSLLDKRSGRDI